MTGPASGQTRERILVVDDDVDIARFVEMTLDPGGLRGGDRARRPRLPWTRSPGSSPDLVILDLMMPELDGVEVTRRLRANADDVGAADHHADREGADGRTRCSA